MAVLQYVLNVPTSVTPGTPVGMVNKRGACVTIGGTFVASLSIEGSIDGVQWDALWPGAGNQLDLVPAKYFIEDGLKMLRINTLAYTSGTPTAILTYYPY